MPHTDATYTPYSTSTNQLVSASNAQTYALNVTYGDWGRIEEYGLQQTNLNNNITTNSLRKYNYGSLNEGQTVFAPNFVWDTNGTGINETYGINGSLQRRETQRPNAQPSEELYRFGADGNLRMYSYDRLFYSLYGYDGGTTRTYKYSFDLSPNWVNGRLESVNFNMHNAMFYPNSYINFNNDGYYTKHYYIGMERIASRLGDQNLSINVNDPELQDRKDWQDSLIRKSVVEITGYNFLPVGEEQTLDDPKPIYELPQVSITNLIPNTSSVYYYHPNHLGSTCYVTDENASVVQGFLYAPFGEITNEHNSSFGNNVLPKYSFNAKELDEETGMYYYEARYYQPPIFTSRDPHFERYPTFSPYTYCANNPVKFIDPDGRDWYQNTEGTAVFWKEGNEPTIERIGETFHNIGSSYVHYSKSEVIFYEQNSITKIYPFIPTNELCISDEGAHFLMNNEGVKLTPYNDSKGYATIGVGHLIGKRNVNEQDIQDWKGFSYSDAMKLFQNDIKIMENEIKSLITVPLTQYQYDAIVSFSFNVGIGGLKKSNFLKSLNNGSYNGNLMMNFHRPKEIIPRRQREVNLFTNAQY